MRRVDTLYDIGDAVYFIAADYSDLKHARREIFGPLKVDHISIGVTLNRTAVYYRFGDWQEIPEEDVYPTRHDAAYALAMRG